MVIISVKMCLNVFQGVMWTIQTLAETQGSVQKALPTTGHVRLAEVKKDFNGKERKIGGSLQYAIDCLLSLRINVAVSRTKTNQPGRQW